MGILPALTLCCRQGVRALGTRTRAPSINRATSRRAMSTGSSIMTKCSDETVVQDMLYRIRQVNSMPPEVESTLCDFCVGGLLLGEVTPKIADLLVKAGPSVFE